MATALTGIPRKGIESTGGLDYVLIADFTELKITETEGIANIVLADDSPITGSNSPFSKYFPETESSSMTDASTVAGATGQKSSEQTGVLVFSKLSTIVRNELKLLSSLRTVIIGVDFNGYAQIMGSRTGALMATTTGTTGTAGGDLNGYTINPRSVDKDLMPTVPQAFLDSLEA